MENIAIVKEQNIFSDQ